MLGGLGPMELFIILVIVLVLFGAKRVPEIGASLGKGIREFKKSMNDIGDQVTKQPEERPIERLGAGDSRPVSTAAQEETRAEPKRLI
ncbi:MAG TPA: twin-arginine translocase TatA/TatE family subunit [Gemmatimonadaceae bacterium]